MGEKKEKEEKEKLKRIAEGGVADGESRGEIETAKIEAELSKLGLEMKAVPADGNCLFKAFSLQLPEPKPVDELRRAVGEHLLVNRSELEPFVTEEDYEGYVEKMSTTAAWGG